MSGFSVPVGACLLVDFFSRGFCMIASFLHNTELLLLRDVFLKREKARQQLRLLPEKAEYCGRTLIYFLGIIKKARSLFSRLY